MLKPKLHKNSVSVYFLLLEMFHVLGLLLYFSHNCIKAFLKRILLSLRLVIILLSDLEVISGYDERLTPGHHALNILKQVRPQDHDTLQIVGEDLFLVH